jgi:hypothetical protein
MPTEQPVVHVSAGCEKYEKEESNKEGDKEDRKLQK